MKVKKMLHINKSSTEEELIKGSRKNKASAQKGLYDRLAPKMLGVCRRYINDHEEAEHVMIGGMVKVFEKLDQFREEGSFEGWVRRILVNECLMYIRKNRGMSLESEGNESESLLVEVDPTMLEAEDLLKLIGTLPVGYKAVFNLYAIEGYSHAEIAKMLDVSENTSKSQLSRARKWLQVRLVEMDSEIEKNGSNGFK